MSATATDYRRPRLSAEGDMYPYKLSAARPPTLRSTIQPRPPTPYAFPSPASESSSSSGEKQFTPPSSLDSPPTLPLELRNTASSINDMRHSSASPIRCSDTWGACDLSGSLHGLPIRITTDEDAEFFAKYRKLKPEQFHAFANVSKCSDPLSRSWWLHIFEASGFDASRPNSMLRDFDRLFRPEQLELEDNPGGDSTYAGSEVDTFGRTALARVRDNEAPTHEGYDEDEVYGEPYGERSYDARLRRADSPAYRYPELRWERPDIDDSDFEYIDPQQRLY